MLLGSAFASVVVTYYTQSVVLGVLGGMVAGLAIAALFGALILLWSGDQIVVGAATNAVVLGLGGYLSFVLFFSPGVTPTVKGISMIVVPWLGDIPWLGQVLFQHTPTVLLLPFVVIAAHVVLFRTPFGLRLRVAGEDPLVDVAAGINVVRVRFTAVLMSGWLCSLGGINLALESLKFYQDSMVAGRGFIALAANIFGGWTAFGGAAASLLFGFSQALMFRVQVFEIPQEFVFMLPYALTIVVLVAAAGRAVAPAALGKSDERRG